LWATKTYLEGSQEKEKHLKFEKKKWEGEGSVRMILQRHSAKKTVFVTTF